MRVWLWIGSIGCVSQVTDDPVVVPPPQDPLWAEDPSSADWARPTIDDPVGEPLACAGVPELADACAGGSAAFVAGVGYDQLQDAVLAASEDQSIYVCPGTWPGALVARTVAIRAVDPAPGATNLTGGGDDPVLTLEDADVLLEGLTLRDGFGKSAGGAIDAVRSVVRVRCGRLEGNLATERGSSGISATDSSVYVDTTTFANDDVADPEYRRAWGILVTSEMPTELDLFVDNSTFEAPARPRVESRAVVVTGGVPPKMDADVAIRNTVFRAAKGQTTPTGGDVTISTRELDLVFEDVTFWEEELASGALRVGGDDRVGAAIARTVIAARELSNTAPLALFGDELDVTIREVTLEDHATTGEGSGLYLAGAGDVLIEDSVFRDLRAGEDGGGIWVFGGDPSTMVVRRTIIEGNSARTGSAIGMLGRGSHLELDEVTLRRNDNSDADGAAVSMPPDGTVVVTASDLGEGDDDNLPDDIRLGFTVLNGGADTDLTHP